MYGNNVKEWKDRRKAGFSLVELIIVIAIMAVLVGILAPQFIKYVEKSRNSTDIQNADEIVKAIQVEYAGNPEFAKAITEECATKNSPHCLAITVSENKVNVPPVVEDALRSAGLIGASTSDHTYKQIKCKSREKWIAYRIVLSDYDQQLMFRYKIYLPGENPAATRDNWTTTKKNYAANITDVMN